MYVARQLNDVTEDSAVEEAAKSLVELPNRFETWFNRLFSIVMTCHVTAVSNLMTRLELKEKVIDQMLCDVLNHCLVAIGYGSPRKRRRRTKKELFAISDGM